MYASARIRPSAPRASEMATGREGETSVPFHRTAARARTGRLESIRKRHPSLRASSGGFVGYTRRTFEERCSQEAGPTSPNVTSGI